MTSSAAADLKRAPASSRSAARGSALTCRGTGGSLGPSYFLEKQAVVIDFGAARTKVGFATESCPRHVLPTPELDVRRSRQGLAFTESEEEWFEILDRLLSQIFFHYLSVSPKDRRVVVCDAVHSSAPFRSALARVLFKRLGVPAVALVADLVLPLYLTGLSSGIVIDCGYTSSRVMATFAGVPILSAYCAGAAGARAVCARLRKMLQESMDAPGWLDEQGVVEDLLACTCYVACDIRSGDGLHLKLKSDKAASYAPGSEHPVAIPSDSRWRPVEVLVSSEGAVFADIDSDGDEDGDVIGIPGAFVRAIEQCPIDVRAAVVQNVVVCGGCAGLRGLLPRLAVEIRDALEACPRTQALAGKLRFTPLDFPPATTVWTGGSVFGALEGASDYTATDYSQGRPLPDWARDGFV